jgi:uncharacterized protein with HEPN domain
MSRADPRRLGDYLRHILEAIDHIQTYTAGMNLSAFMADRKTQDAVIRNLEVIGEACNNVVKNQPAFASSHSSVPWGFAYEMRNALSHGYFAVDLDIVWRTTQQDLPGLRVQIQRFEPLDRIQGADRD